MNRLQVAPGMFGATRLKGIRRGVEKESLRATAIGALALTPHPAALGSALTHPHITTDYSESQIELITGVHASPETCLEELLHIHQFTLRALDKEMLWASSMPCLLPADETIPIGSYGPSNVGRAKSVYRMGLAHRYGRRMQTISGVHYNWSLPGVDSDQYFALIRNFRRHAFLLLYLFGASPAVCSSFVAGRDHELQVLGSGTMYLPHATSLRMGRLGYQSDAQSTLAVSYNSLDGYAASLHEALTRPYPPYEAVGIVNPGGEYSQLATSLLQIENEFYGTIRPKRIIRAGERPLHALRERGVEYVEVRLLDLDPFVPIGIKAQTMRFLDIFLLHCLQAASPPDSPQEVAQIGRNQHRTAAFGRQPGLMLERGNETIALADWATQLLEACAVVAADLDAAHQTSDYGDALRAAQSLLHEPALLPSARVLAVMEKDFDNSFNSFTCAQSLQIKAKLMALPFGAGELAKFTALSEQSLADQKVIEAADRLPFETYRQQYVAPERLGLSKATNAPVLAAA